MRETMRRHGEPAELYWRRRGMRMRPLVLILEDLQWDTIGKGYLVVASAMALMLFLNVRTINNYD